MKILFLDIDGVLNSEEFFKKRAKGLHPTAIDNYMALLVYRIVEATGCKIVLSSSWRGYEDGEKEIERMIGVKLHDRTPRSESHLRGVEIHEWLRKNVKGFNSTYKGDFRIAILDDDSDMLMWQKDHFFHTSWKVGLTDEIAAAVIKHLNGTD